MNPGLTRRIRSRRLGCAASLLLLMSIASSAAAEPASTSVELCKSNEQTVWSCSSKLKTYSLCASEKLDASSGYMQYRAAKEAVVEFTYPAELRHPKGVFEYWLLARGGSLEFENAGFRYTIYEPLIGATTIVVTREGSDVATIECDTATDALTLTTTIDLFKAAGVLGEQAP